MGSIRFDVQLSGNGTTDSGIPKLAFVIPSDITKMIQKRFPCEQVKVTLTGKTKRIAFVINLTPHSHEAGKERLKGMIPKKWIKEAEAFKDEVLSVKIESI